MTVGNTPNFALGVRCPFPQRPAIHLPEQYRRTFPFVASSLRRTRLQSAPCLGYLYERLRGRGGPSGEPRGNSGEPRDGSRRAEVLQVPFSCAPWPRAGAGPARVDIGGLGHARDRAAARELSLRRHRRAPRTFRGQGALATSCQQLPRIWFVVVIRLQRWALGRCSVGPHKWLKCSVKMAFY